MITRLEAYNYRCFQNLSVDLGTFHVLAGANGSGKTTLLDIPILIGDMLRARRGIAEAFLWREDGRQARASGLNELLTCGTGDDITFVVEARLPGDIEGKLAETSASTAATPPPTHARYEIRLELFNDRLTVAEEYLFLFPGGDYAPPAKSGMLGREARNAQSRRKTIRSWRMVIDRPVVTSTTMYGETIARSRRQAKPGLSIVPDQLALDSVPADRSLYPAAHWLRDLLDSGAVFYDPDWSLLRTAASPGDPETVVSNGRNTPWLARLLREEDPERYSDWVDHVRIALPQIQGIEVRVREDDRHAYFAVRYAGGHQVVSSGLSDGTLRILALTLLTHLPERSLPPFLVTEEPENGLHPQAIESVLESLDSMYTSQVLVSTHSPVVLAQTKLENILTARLDDDSTASIVPGPEHPRLRDWRGGIDLGQLYASGVFA